VLQDLAAAALAAAELPRAGSRYQRVLAAGFAAAADSLDQVRLLRSWLERQALPAGVILDLELRAKILTNLAARDLAENSDLAAYADDDPVSGDTLLATCSARRPSEPAKEAAWRAALAPGQPSRLALAYANGIWVAGQEDLVGQFRYRYFSEALPAIRRLESQAAQRLARALFPVTLADEATLAATDAELGQMQPTDPTHAVLLDHRAIVHEVIAARTIAAAARLSRSGSPCSDRAGGPD